MYNIIGDIAGNLKTLRALLKKMPAGELIALGDLPDRGPDSAGVIEFVRTNGRSLMGNHDHIFYKTYELAEAWLKAKATDPNLSLYNFATTFGAFYLPGQFVHTGGAATLRSYGLHWSEAALKQARPEQYFADMLTYVQREHIDFLKSLPKFLELDEGRLFLSHAPRPYWRTNEESAQESPGYFFYEHPLSSGTFLWNRKEPRPLPGCLQIHGHNGFPHPRYYTDQHPKGTYLPSATAFAIGIDTSKVDVLTGIHYPSGEIFQQEIID